MDLITALAVSIGGLAAVATYLFLGILPPGWQLWAAFIGWASFYGAGGKESGLQASIAANIWGALLALVALLVITRSGMADSLGLPLCAAIVVGLSVVVLVLGAKNPMLAAIPSSVYGYASVAALALITGKFDTLSQPTLANPFVAVLLSMIIGNIFGYVSEALGGQLVGTKTA